MRPRGEIRRALAGAARQLAGEQVGAFTWRDVAQRAQVGWCEARQTVKDMVRAGELQRVGAAHRQHARRPMALFALAPEPERTPAGEEPELDTLMRAWSR